jgi:hypothetical protein
VAGHDRVGGSSPRSRAHGQAGEARGHVDAHRAGRTGGELIDERLGGGVVPGDDGADDQLPAGPPGDDGAGQAAIIFCDQDLPGGGCQRGQDSGAVAAEDGPVQGKNPGAVSRARARTTGPGPGEAG